MGDKWGAGVSEIYGRWTITILSPDGHYAHMILQSEQDIHDFQTMIDELDNKLLGILGQLETERESNE